jgi:hypothetical protein
MLFDGLHSSCSFENDFKINLIAPIQMPIQASGRISVQETAFHEKMDAQDRSQMCRAVRHIGALPPPYFESKAPPAGGKGTSIPTTFSRKDPYGQCVV